MLASNYPLTLREPELSKAAPPRRLSPLKGLVKPGAAPVELRCTETMDATDARPASEVDAKQLQAVQEIYGMERVSARWMAICYYSRSQNVQCCKVVRLADVAYDQWTFSVVDQDTCLAYHPDKQLVLRNKDFTILWYGHGRQPDGGALLKYELDGRILEQFYKSGDRMEEVSSLTGGDAVWEEAAIARWAVKPSMERAAAAWGVAEMPPPRGYIVTSNNKRACRTMVVDALASAQPHLDEWPPLVSRR